MDEDWFDSVLNLEDDYYEEGYAKGVQDGSQAGRIEGRQFGLEKGFEKYLAMGQLNGKACVWAARLPPQELSANPKINAVDEGSEGNQSIEKQSKFEGMKVIQNVRLIALLPPNSRLGRHITTLYALTEPESLSTQNNEESVSDFDDRYKRALSKAKVVRNIIGEKNVDLAAEWAVLDGLEDKAKQSQANEGGRAKEPGKSVKITREAVKEKNIEDFGLKTASS